MPEGTTLTERPSWVSDWAGLPADERRLYARMMEVFAGFAEYTDTEMQCQGQRGICELRFPHTGRFMFHAHQSEFAELGWSGIFDVREAPHV